MRVRQSGHGQTSRDRQANDGIHFDLYRASFGSNYFGPNSNDHTFCDNTYVTVVSNRLEIKSKCCLLFPYKLFLWALIETAINDYYFLNC